MGKKLTTEEFIEKAKKVHGDKYDYSLVVYCGTKTKVKIICPKHGDFEQTPEAHFRGIGCKKCGYENRNNRRKIRQEIFMEKSRELHKNKYDYSLVEYIDTFTKIKIICPIHGIFEQKPVLHLSGHGCQKCGIENGIENSERKLSIEEFIEKSRKVHGDKYDYSLVEYKNNRINVKIICTDHGVFEQRPAGHINKKYGCPECSNNGKIENKSLYILYDSEDKIYKIGRSKNVKKRINIIVEGKERKTISLIREYKNKGNMENIIHKKYEQYRIIHTFYEDGKTEWFNLTKEQIEEIDKVILP